MFPRSRFDRYRPRSPFFFQVSQGSAHLPQDDTSNEGLVVDVDGPVLAPAQNPPAHAALSGSSHLAPGLVEPLKVSRLTHHFTFGSSSSGRARPGGRGTNKRGRPRGSRRGGSVGGKGRGLLLLQPPAQPAGTQGDAAPTATAVHSPHGECSSKFIS